MSLNDSEIDVLLRRYAKAESSVQSGEHLDADELNAFTAGALPADTRSRYVSHLADCDDCRRAVAELAAASGRFDQMAAPTRHAKTESWWQKIGKLFAPSRLRYAAFAAVLIAVVGIGYGIWRKSRERPSAPIAQKEPAPGEEARTASPSPGQVATGIEASPPAVAKAIPQPTPMPFLDQKQQPQTTTVSPPPPKPADALAPNESAASAPTTGGTVSSTNAAVPSYAPAPSTETVRVEDRAREQQNLDNVRGPQRGESLEKNKSMDDRSRAGDFAKGRDADQGRNQADQPVAKEEPKDEERAARKRSESRPATLASRSAGVRQEESKSDKAEKSEEADTRSVAGRKFKRQGNVWVDEKLKPSMSVTAISRGSEDFEKLDSDLRSISQQFSGPVVIVWKGKAYRIQ